MIDRPFDVRSTMATYVHIGRFDHKVRRYRDPSSHLWSLLVEEMNALQEKLVDEFRIARN